MTRCGRFTAINNIFCLALNSQSAWSLFTLLVCYMEIKSGWHKPFNLLQGGVMPGIKSLWGWSLAMPLWQEIECYLMNAQLVMKCFLLMKYHFCLFLHKYLWNKNIFNIKNGCPPWKPVKMHICSRIWSKYYVRMWKKIVQVNVTDDECSKVI